MKKSTISTMIIAALLTQQLRAETDSNPILMEEAITSPVSNVSIEEELAGSNVAETADLETIDPMEGTIVEAETEGATETAKAVHEATHKSKRKNWGSVLLAAGAVAVAIVVLILVSNHTGQTSHN